MLYRIVSGGEMRHDNDQLSAELLKKLEEFCFCIWQFGGLFELLNFDSIFMIISSIIYSLSYSSYYPITSDLTSPRMYYYDLNDLMDCIWFIILL